MGSAAMVKDSRRSLWRSRWAAIGAAVAVTMNNPMKPVPGDQGSVGVEPGPAPR